MNNFTKETAGDIVVYTVNLKRATMKESEEFKELLLNEIKNGQNKIVVDLSKCEFMDSSFLGSIIISYKEAARKGGALKVAAVHSDAQVILEITGTAKIFDQYKTRTEAIKSFNGMPTEYS